MSDSPKQRAGTEADLRREMAYREEAEALREDLTQYLREGAVGDEVRGLLAGILREELPGMLRAALADETFRAALRRDVAQTVLEGLDEQVRGRRPLLDEPVLQPLPPRLQPTNVGYAVARPRDAWKWGLAGLVAALLAGAVVVVSVMYLDRQPGPSGSASAGNATSRPAPTTSGASGASGANSASAAADPQAEAPVVYSVAELRQTWVDVVKRNAPPAGSPVARLLHAHPADKAFDCWLGGATSDKLGALVRDVALGKVDDGVVRQRLAAAFAPCVGDYAPKAGAPSLVVYAAQAAAGQVFAAAAESRPASCGEPPTPTAAPDGKSGAGTEELLNALQQCSGGTALPRIDAHSGPRGYLLSLYLGLTELRREATLRNAT